MSWILFFRPWSAWVGGDLQSINTLRFWLRDGYWHHYGLFLTQGYSPFIQLLEQPSLWHHGLASVRQIEQVTAQSIYYNHYPTTYLLPLFVVSRILGSVQLLPLQITQLLISLTTLFIMYAALVRVARARDATIVTLASTLSWLFTDFFFSLNNLPLDDLFRWSFILCSLLERFGAHPQRQRVLMWIIFFLLSLVSLDSIIFCGLWLVLTDTLSAPFISLAKARRWIVYALAPILAQGLVFMQSVAAWGWKAAIADKTTSFQTRSMEGQTTSLFLFLKQRLYAWSIELHSIWFGNLSLPTSLRYLAVLIALGFLAFLAYFLFTRRDRPSGRAIYLGKLSVVAFFSALGFGGAVPVAGYMPYQGRQFVPFFALFALFLLELHRESVSLPPRERSVYRLVSSLTVLLTICLIGSGLRTLVRTTPSPVFGRETSSPQMITTIAEFLRTQTNQRRAIIFILDPDQQLSRHFPKKSGSFSYQISVLASSTADRLLLAFSDLDTLTRDVRELRKHSHNGIIPVFVTPSPSLTERLQKEDFLRCPSEQLATPPKEVLGWFVATGASCQST